MNKNLLIVGAGAYGVVASDIAHEMGCFDKIDFVDDENESTPTGEKVIGKIKDLAEINSEYSNIVVAIDSPDIRLNLLTKIQEETSYRIVTLFSPKAVHVEANSTIAASTLVPAGTRVKCGEVFDRKKMDINDFFFTPEEWTKRMNESKKPIEMRTPVPISGQLYNFDDVM